MRIQQKTQPAQRFVQPRTKICSSKRISKQIKCSGPQNLSQAKPKIEADPAEILKTGKFIDRIRSATRGAIYAALCVTAFLTGSINIIFYGVGHPWIMPVASFLTMLVGGSLIARLFLLTITKLYLIPQKPKLLIEYEKVFYKGRIPNQHFITRKPISEGIWYYFKLDLCLKNIDAYIEKLERNRNPSYAFLADSKELGLKSLTHRPSADFFKDRVRNLVLLGRERVEELKDEVYQLVQSDLSRQLITEYCLKHSVKDVVDRINQILKIGSF